MILKHIKISLKNNDYNITKLKLLFNLLKYKSIMFYIIHF
jgi:hypothetical protein